MNKELRTRLVEKALMELERVLDESPSETQRLQAAQTALRFFSEEAKQIDQVAGIEALRRLLLRGDEKK